ncbi:LacI family DNA-binding transcriptional regulator [Actinoallomurus iriomotensis]|uniref:LacI family transcriptional regulator n=1 Tax=Actinoallomurus iriomotensis TaxID=478107 RepID=A0A9W6RDK6_9ACTN|nr:LacI family DNA-binding transcriptional regulator [Actinoallomurus iriomotensis]GLY73828.1 LacI family transcriptional regulator [Actinoallomurus iriomotensis]
MSDAASRRITQRDIARLAGVSQTTVSLVLNNRPGDETRIPRETRDRVLSVIRETGYVADPVARRLADRHNRILGVFTYEPVFPSATADFYHPFLVGIEECAERLGCDLLLLTSVPVIDGRRRIYHEANRLRLADGCVLLGRSLDRDELARLVSENFPFVSVGRRDDAGGPVPYVGTAYGPAVRALVERARALGHTRLAYLGHGEGAESLADRMVGFREGAGDLPVRHVRPTAGGPAEWLDALEGVTVVFAEEYADAVALVDEAFGRGLSVPADLSIVTLGDPTRPARTDIDFTGFRIPRREMGRQAIQVLTRLLEGGPLVQRLLPCELVVGSTLSGPAA